MEQAKIKEALEQIEKDVKNNKVVLYMKGDKQNPMCGFSGRVVQILNSKGVNYETRNVLADDYIRQAIKDFSDWPTLPQLYVNGEFVGGCDIVTEMNENGELDQILK